jgi:hypothetical protein
MVQGERGPGLAGSRETGAGFSQGVRVQGDRGPGRPGSRATGVIIITYLGSQICCFSASVKIFNSGLFSNPTIVNLESIHSISKSRFNLKKRV